MTRRPRTLANCARSFRALALLGLALSTCSSPLALQAATIYWDTTGSTWDNPASWSTTSGAATPNPALPPGAGDIARFNTNGANSPQTVLLDSDQAASGLFFASTGTVTLLGNGGDRILALGSDGIFANFSSGTATIGSSAPGQNVHLSLQASQSWSHFGAGSLVVNGNSSLGTAGAATLTLTGDKAGGLVAGTLSNGLGTLSVAKTNTGTWTLLGNNTYTGSTTLSGTGTLALGSDSVASGSIIGSSSYDINGGTLALNNTAGNTNRLGDSTAVNLGGGALSLTGNAVADTTEVTGELNLTSGANTVTVTSQAGRVTTLNASALSRTGNSTALVRGTNLNQSGGSNVSRVILADGGASLTQVGTNTLNNAAAGDATQGLKIVPYLIGDASATGAGSNFVTYDSTLGLRVLTNAQQTTLSATYENGGVALNAISFNGTITAAGPTVNSLLMNNVASQTLNGNGTLTILSGALLKTGNATSTIGSGFSGLTLGNGVANEGVIHSLSNTLNINTAISVTGGGGLTKSGSGTLSLGAANLYTGATTLNAGTLRLAHQNAVQHSTVQMTGGTLNFDASVGGNAFTLGGLSGTQNVSLSNGSSGVAVSIGNNNANTTYSGVLSNTGSVNKIGSGTLTLAGANTYTGATTVSNGTLLVTGSLAAGSTVNVNAGILGGTGTIGGATTVGSGAVIMGGSGSLASGTLSLSNSLTLNDGSFIALTLGAGGAHSTLARTGGTWTFDIDQQFTFYDVGATVGFYDNIITGLALDPGTVGTWTITNAGWTGTFSFDGANIDLNLVSVPEPGVLVLLIGSVSFLGFVRRRARS